MILTEAQVYHKGEIKAGVVLINEGIIHSVLFSPSEEEFYNLVSYNKDGKIIDCKKKIILPGIIDIHSHLRDMDQSEKETFLTGTKAAAFSGITSVFNMPNTIPPAITAEQVKKWMEKAENKIFVDVGFIAGVPRRIDESEIKKIIDLGVIGFKIYPHNPLNGINWTDPLNIQKILLISSKYQIPIFFHPDWPLTEREEERIFDKFINQNYSLLKIHNKIYTEDAEAKFVKFLIENYRKVIAQNNIPVNKYPMVHICHVSCEKSIKALKKTKRNYQEILETIKEGYYELDVDGIIIYVNQGLCTILGFSKEELINKHYL